MKRNLKIELNLNPYIEQIKEMMQKEYDKVRFELPYYDLFMNKMNQKNGKNEQEIDVKLCTLLRDLLHNYLKELIEVYKKQNKEDV